MVKSRYAKRRAQFLEQPEVRAGYEDGAGYANPKTFLDAMARFQDALRHLFTPLLSFSERMLDVFMTWLTGCQKETPTMSYFDDLNKNKWAVNPFCVDPTTYKYSTEDLVKRVMEQTKTKTIYRVKREDGSVVAIQEGPGIGGISVDLFNLYAPGRYETEEAAHKAAIDYCEKQYNQLLQAKQTHRAWLTRHDAQVQRLAIGDKVAFCGKPSFANRVRGLVKPVIAVQKSEARGFEYRVDFPRLEEVWIPQADLTLRERGHVKGVQRPEVRTSVDLLGLKARVKKEGGSFRTIEKVTFAADGSGARFQLANGCLYWKRDELEIEGIDTFMLDED